MLREAFKKTVKHAIIFGVGRLTSRIVGLVLIPVYTRFIIPSDYGALAMIIMAGSIATICLDMGLCTAIFRYYFLFKDEQKRKKVISNVFYWTLIAGMIFTALLIIVAEPISSVFLKASVYAPHLILMFFTIYLRVLRNIPLSIMRAREQSILFSLLSIIDLILGLVLNIYFVVFLKRGIMGILEAGLIVGILTSPLYLIFIRNDIQWCVSTTLMKKLLRFGLPLIPASLAALILTLSSRYFLTTYCSLEEVGLYTLGHKLGIMINIMLVQPFQLIWPTMMYSISDKKQAGEYYSRILVYYLMAVGGVALVLSIFAKEIVSLLAAPEYLEAYKVIPLIAFSYVAYGVYFVTTIGINLKEKTYYLPWIVGSAAGLNLILNYVFIPQFGLMGAAVASFISYIALVVINYSINQRWYKVNYNWRRIITLGLFYLLTVILFSYAVIQGLILKLLYCFSYVLLIYFVLLDTKERRGISRIMSPFIDKICR